jgi:hypothetical protein
MQRQRTLILQSLSAAALHGQCFNRPASPILPTGLKLTIHAEKLVGEISKPTKISIELKNDSNVSIEMWDRWSSDRNYELHVYDKGGKELPLTEKGSLARNHFSGSQSKVVLAPGERYTDEQDPTGWYAISVPGDYTVEVCRNLIGWGNIYSNKIVIPFVMPAESPGAKQDK